MARRSSILLALLGLYLTAGTGRSLWPLFPETKAPVAALVAVQLLALIASGRIPLVYTVFAAATIPGILLPVLYGGELPAGMLAAWIGFVIIGEYRLLYKRAGGSRPPGLSLRSLPGLAAFLALLLVSGAALYLIYYGVTGYLDRLLLSVGGDVRLFYGIISLTSLYNIIVAAALIYFYYRFALLASWVFSSMQSGGARLLAREATREARAEEEALLGMRGVQYRGLYEAFNIALSLLFLPLFFPASGWVSSLIGAEGVRARVLSSLVVYAIIWLLLRPSARMIVEPGSLWRRPSMRRTLALVVVSSLSIVAPLILLSQESVGAWPVVKTAITGNPYYESDPLSRYLEDEVLAERYESLVESLDEILSLIVNFFWGG